MKVRQTKQVMDLTTGSVTGKLVRYSVPMVITSLLQALYGMVDLIVAGKFIGSNGISAINNSSQIMNILTALVIGITTGGNILVGQYFGHQDDEGRRKASVSLYTVSLLLGVIICVFTFAFSRNILVALGAPALEDATVYLRICSVGMLFIFGYNALSSIVRGVGNSRQPLYAICATTGLNIVLDILFMGPLGMGTKGAAIATVISQGVSFLICLVYIMRNRDYFGVSVFGFHIDWKELKMLLKLGLPCSVQMTVGGISWLTVTYLINTYGVTVSAGNGVSVKIKDLCQLFITALSNSAATMIAQTLGAGKFDRAKKVMYQAMKITVSVSVLLIIMVELFAPALAGIFTNEPAVIEAAARNLRIEIIGQVFYAIFFVYHSLAIGAGHSIFAFASSFVNCILVRTTLSILFNHLWGLDGVYLACMIAPSISVPLGYLYTRSNVWRKTLVSQ